MKYRRELKLVLPSYKSETFSSWIEQSKLFLRVSYPNRDINSIYYDTLDFGGFNSNLDGISRREKYRFRWYGKIDEMIGGIFEIKKRKNMLGSKKAYSINLTSVPKYHHDLLNKIASSLDIEDNLYLSHNLFPAVLIRYDRSYYVSSCGLIRVTLDKNITSYDQLNGHKINLVDYDDILQYHILEIKYPSRLHYYVTDLVSDIPVRVTRNSKYINSLLRFI